MDFKNKNGLIFGVANHRSIAFNIAKFLSENGAKIGYSYQNDRVKDSVEKSLEGLSPKFIEECDVLDEKSLNGFFSKAKREFENIKSWFGDLGYPEDVAALLAEGAGMATIQSLAMKNIMKTKT